jgi:ADP-ribose pyrophosphatase YjhB (NUDIX family)
MPTRVISGHRVGRLGRLRVGCSAVIFNAERDKILLTRRTDNGLWCLPGGGMDSGENAAEACIREVREETGLHIRVTRLIGIYTSPDWLIEYPDGNCVQIVAMSFEGAPIDGEITPTNEVIESGFFSKNEITQKELMENHLQRILDAFAMQEQAFIR